jgi:pseudaminic acid synthase
MKKFQVPVGLSDHTLGIVVPVAAVARGACVIEKHFTLSRLKPEPDSSFSLEPAEFKDMVDSVRITEKAIGVPLFAPTEKKASRIFRRSLFVVKDMKRGEEFKEDNVRSIRPGHGLSPKTYEDVLGKKAMQDIKFGTPLNWELVGK